jgi:hypothetical protein
MLEGRGHLSRPSRRLLRPTTANRRVAATHKPVLSGGLFVAASGFLAGAGSSERRAKGKSAFLLAVIFQAAAPLRSGKQLGKGRSEERLPILRIGDASGRMPSEAGGTPTLPRAWRDGGHPSSKIQHPKSPRRAVVVSATKSGRPGNASLVGGSLASGLAWVCGRHCIDLDGGASTSLARRPWSRPSSRSSLGTFTRRVGASAAFVGSGLEGARAAGGFQPPQGGRSRRGRLRKHL